MGGVDFIAIGKDAPNLPKFLEKGGILGGRGKGAPFSGNECRNSYVTIFVTLSIKYYYFFHLGRFMYKGLKTEQISTQCAFSILHNKEIYIDIYT